MVNTNSYFADPAHLNDKGARFYTEMIINDIKLRGNERTRIYDNQQPQIPTDNGRRFYTL